MTFRSSKMILAGLKVRSLANIGINTGRLPLPELVPPPLS